MLRSSGLGEPVYAPVLVTAPAAVDAFTPAGSPVSLTLAKQHLRVDSDDEIELIKLYLGAATVHLDGNTGWLRRALLTQRWRQDFDGFAGCLRLPLAPVATVVSVTYQDTSDVTQTVSGTDYQSFDLVSDPHIRFVASFSVPATRSQRPVVSVTFDAGYGATSDDVPAAIRAAMLLMVGDMFQQREAKVTNSLAENSAVHRLLEPYRRGWAA